MNDYTYKPEPDDSDEEESFMEETDSTRESFDDEADFASLKQMPAEEGAPLAEEAMVADAENAPVDPIPGEAAPGELVVDEQMLDEAETEPDAKPDDDVFRRDVSLSDELDFVSIDGLPPYDNDALTSEQFLHDDANIDIDAALASVASLSDYVAQREAEEAEAAVRQQQQTEVEAEAARRRERYHFARPGLSTLQRGQITSFVPALLLMAFGAWLTFAFSATDAPPSTELIVLVALAGLALIFITAWMDSGRWARGSLFLGLIILLTGGLAVWLAQPDSLGVEGWPLFLSALGAAGVLSALLSRGGGRAQVFTGLALILGGLAGLLVTTSRLDSAMLEWTETWGLLLIGVTTAVLLLLPLARGRRA